MRFKLKNILEAEGQSKVLFSEKSKLEYYVAYEHGFQVMPDEKTIIGVEYHEGCNKLVMEDVTDSEIEPCKFGKNSKCVYTILPNRNFTSIFVGDGNKKLMRYDLDRSSKT
jgi:hypothetical protein